MKKFIAVILSVAALLPCVFVGVSAGGRFKLDGLDAEYQSIMESQADDSFLLGSLSAKYESNGNPGTISENKDTGGVSYGAYQFSSYYGVPYDFAVWCINSGKGYSSGQRLLNAYAADGNAYGYNFNNTWSALAAENSGAFLLLQHDYTKAKYYDVVVAKLESSFPGFDIDNYTIAFKNVVWSRAVQHGVNTDVIAIAFNNIGGFRNKSEDVLINAVYDQSSLLVDYAPEASAKQIQLSSVLKNGLSTDIVGKYLYYFCRNTSDIQASVYKRLAINERADALAMYEEYKGSGGGNSTPSQPSDDPSVTPPTTGDPTQDLINSLFSWFEILIEVFIEIIGIFASLLVPETVPAA